MKHMNDPNGYSHSVEFATPQIYFFSREGGGSDLPPMKQKRKLEREIFTTHLQTQINQVCKKFENLHDENRVKWNIWKGDAKH